MHTQELPTKSILRCLGFKWSWGWWIVCPTYIEWVCMLDPELLYLRIFPSFVTGEQSGPMIIYTFFFFFCLFRTVPATYRGSQARGLIGAVATSLHHSQPQQRQIQATSTTYTTAHRNTRSLTHQARSGIKPASSWILDRFISAEPQQKLLHTHFWEITCLSLDKHEVFRIDKG